RRLRSALWYPSSLRCQAAFRLEYPIGSWATQTGRHGIKPLVPHVDHRSKFRTSPWLTAEKSHPSDGRAASPNRRAVRRLVTTIGSRIARSQWPSPRSTFRQLGLIALVATRPTYVWACC